MCEDKSLHIHAPATGKDGRNKQTIGSRRLKILSRRNSVVSGARELLKVDRSISIRGAASLNSFGVGVLSPNLEPYTYCYHSLTIT